MLTFVDSVGSYFELAQGTLIAALCIILGVNIGLYLLRSFGIYKMAKNRGVNNLWMAFVPILWIYTIGQILGKISLFNKKVNFGLIAVIVIGIVQVLTLVKTVMVYVPLVDLYFRGEQIFYAMDPAALVKAGVFTKEQAYLFNTQFFTVSPINATISNAYKVIASIINIAGSILSIFEVILTVMLYIYLFRAYNPRNYFMFAILSLFLGIFGILVFVLRNKQYVDYNEYMKEQYARMYQNRANFMNSNSQYGGQTPPVDEPFKEYGEKDSDDPFDEFNDKN